MKLQRKLTLFVGSFKSTTKKGGTGGQLFACMSIVNSAIGENINFKLIDTTADTNLHRSFVTRFLKSLIRFLKFIYYCSIYEFSSILIFSSNGFSFLEKGSMAIIASYLTKGKVIFAPRSGRIKNEITKKYNKFGKLVFERATIVLCQGLSWKEEFQSAFPNVDRSKFVVLKNWIKSSNYISSRDYRVIHIRFLFLGWIERDKGIFDLLEVISELKNEGYTFQLNIAGGGKHENEMNQFIINNNLISVVNYLGWVLGNEKIKLLSESDVFVLPSYFEGSPNSLLEAMASSLGIISSNVGAIPDIVDETFGFLISPGNKSELKNALTNYIKNPDLIKVHGKIAHEKVVAEHELSNAINFLETILQLKEIINYSPTAKD